MPKTRIDLTGKTFGDLTAIKYLGRVNSSNNTYWLCRCSCGVEKVVVGYSLRNGYSKSCGRYHEDHSSNHKLYRHGSASSRLYSIWAKMKQKCYSNNPNYYVKHQSKSIQVCKEWKESFVSFQTWATANGYEDHLTLDRIDLDKNFEPSNCKWVLLKDQQTTKGTKVLYEIDGIKKTTAQWAKELGISKSELYAKYHYGYRTREEILNKSPYAKNAVLIEIEGETRSLSEWSRKSGLSKQIIAQRLKAGKTGKDLLKPTK